jgi:hypothetical protein
MATQQMQHAFGREMLDQLLDWIVENMEPDEVFDDQTLRQWAEDHGWLKASELPAEVQEMLP